MSRIRSQAEGLLIDVIAQAVTPPLKAAGFRKTGMNYHRRRGDTVQVVNVQVSHGSTGTEKRFYVNVGIAFDALSGLAGLPVLERPKEYECDERGTRSRLELLVPGAPDRWVIRDREDVGMTVELLRGFFDRLVAELDRIDGLVAYRSHPWFDRFRPMRENAQILYLLGDLDGAWGEVQDLVTLFSDRPNASRADWWVERLGLSGLKPRLLEGTH
jgi:hypothetical protein